MFAEAAEAHRAVTQMLAANGERFAALAQHLRNEPPGVVLTCARGSSDHAATFAKYLIETRIGIPVASSAPSIASIYGVKPKLGHALGLAISQSGASPDLLALVDTLSSAGAAIAAMVNVADSPLAQRADWLVTLEAVPERSVAATKSYIASLAAIVALVDAWSGESAWRSATLPGLLEQAWNCEWTPLSAGLADARGLFVIGRGIGLGIAQEAALKLKETCGLHAEAFSAAELKHGPMALVGPDFPVLVFRQPDETAESVDSFARDLAAQGAPVFVAGAKIPGTIQLQTIEADAIVAPILQIQSFYRAAVSLSVARGFDPDRPPLLSKVTETV
jgi:glucosamine--fructose-6-phosphate aminotransferase (isomerizing)